MKAYRHTALALSSAVVLMVAGVETAASADPQQAAPPTCHGRSATVVGQPGRTTGGTAGDDVIVTNGGSVDAGDGDDLICLTDGASRYAPGITIQAGPGRDTVDATAHVGYLIPPVVFLGDGSDSYLGSPDADDVRAGGGGRDRIFTLDGRDHVSAGGTMAKPDRDLVRLGPGDDTMDGRLDPSSQWFGDQGFDTVDLPSDPAVGVKHDWLYDVPRHGAFRDDARVQGFRGFENYVLLDDVDDGGRGAAARSVRFVGGSGPDRFYFLAAVRGQVGVDLGPGDDDVYLNVFAGSVPGHGYVVTGGPGTDTFALGGGFGEDSDHPATEYAQVDLRRRAFSTGGCDSRTGCPTSTTPAVHTLGTQSGFENVIARYFGAVRLTGTAGPNHLLAPESCRGSIVGGSGDDELAGGTDYLECGVTGPDGSVTTPGARLEGGDGDDAITGGSGDDTIIGGDGNDSADGQDGVDACEAETISDCES